jgi:hypothetical protein
MHDDSVEVLVTAQADQLKLILSMSLVARQHAAGATMLDVLEEGRAGAGWKNFFDHLLRNMLANLPCTVDDDCLQGAAFGPRLARPLPPFLQRQRGPYGNRWGPRNKRGSWR